MNSATQFAYICYIICTVVSLLTAIVLILIMLKVIKKVGTSDLIIPTMLLMLVLSAISKLNYFADTTFANLVIFELGCGLFFIDQIISLKQSPADPDNDVYLENTCSSLVYTSL